MQVAPVPNLKEVSANACFEALLWAMSRPGLQHRLPQKGNDAIIDALIDRECKVYVSEPELIATVSTTGAEITSIGEACHIFFSDIPDAKILQQINTGTDYYPDEGATIIIPVKFGSGQTIRLSGPGVNGEVNLSLSGIPEDFWQVRAACTRYPMGFELIFVDSDQVVCLPRSTKAEML